MAFPRGKEGGRRRFKGKKYIFHFTGKVRPHRAGEAGTLGSLAAELWLEAQLGKGLGSSLALLSGSDLVAILRARPGCLKLLGDGGIRPACIGFQSWAHVLMTFCHLSRRYNRE